MSNGGMDALEGSPRSDYDFHLFIHSMPGTAIGSADSAVKEKTKSYSKELFLMRRA